MSALHAVPAPVAESVRVGMVARLTTSEAAVRARRHPVTVRRALEAGELHGRQSKAGGRWLVREDCLESWLDGEKCQHQVNVTPFRRRAAGAGAVVGRSRSGK